MSENIESGKVFETKDSFNDQIIKASLKKELQNMRDRANGIERTDTKYLVLRDFVQKLETQSFEDVFNGLSEEYQHAIITRLENQASHMGGEISWELIKKFQEKVYGTVTVGNDININREKKWELEEKLQKENLPSDKQ